MHRDEQMEKIWSKTAERDCSLSDFLLHDMELTKRQIKQAKFRKDGIRVNSNRARVTHELKAGDKVEVKLEDCSADFAFLQNLPGRKLLLKGNHDYWWTTMAKMNAYLAANGFDSLSFLHNNCVFAEGLALCGTRSWLFDAGQPHDEKVMSRECGRLRASLEAAGDTEKAVFLHYPPIYPQADAGEVVALLREYGVKRCFYGHLHGPSIPRAVQGELDGIEYKLISADALRFFPYKI